MPSLATSPQPYRAESSLGASMYVPENVQGNWRRAASCRRGDPNELFVSGARQREARLVCLSCPVRTECLAHALDQRIEFGVWGGMTERERRALLRRRPDVHCWAELLRAARDEHEERAEAG